MVSLLLFNEKFILQIKKAIIHIPCVYNDWTFRLTFLESFEWRWRMPLQRKSIRFVVLLFGKNTLLVPIFYGIFLFILVLIF